MTVPSPHPPRPGDEPDVLVAVVTYNSANIVNRFLEALPGALAGAGTATVVVVDNDSQDGTASLVRSLAPWVVVVEAGGNLGYAAGINRALAHTRPRRGAYILNPDAVPSPGSVDILARAAEEHDRTGITVPRIVGADGRLKPSLRREPTIARAFGEALLGGHRAGRFAALGEVMTDSALYVDGARADWATGAAMFVARRAIDAVGSWAEEYFLYSEETDFALRVRDAGLELRLAASAEVVHPGGEQTTSPWLWSLATVNRTRLYRSRHGRAPSAIFFGAVLLNECLRARRPTSWEAARALVRGVRPRGDSIALSVAAR
ncbi:glycosyltransferase family 2 protein [Georgenia satyanarayanai]|uniref:glycosyltransferase family 2 protein n=1 Tax=Georgenia satyanarayanai TaxID=860221 RepID=UPI00203C4F7C|nr:glycosyltransferase family 2 protein [Georgenia satyanarayanai]MCM3660813.1 glycosyltransferase family 2 protein [Georgenia satyanarayanai]